MFDLLGLYCQTVGSIPSTMAGWFWVAIKALWPWYAIGIIVFFIAWTLFEIFLDTGWKSENNFSPVYNRIVGSGVYALFQGLTYLILTGIFTQLVYCRPWSLVVHYFVFLLTGGFLHLIRFWPYWRIPFIGKVRFY